MAESIASRWPGGFHPSAFSGLPEGVVSRAWLKLDEAIRVFGIPLVRGQRAIELGASPGGACQRLLEAGLDVVGVDPALVDPVVASRPRFTQWRMRAREVPLEKFRGCDWLVADMNIDPKSTLAALGRAATAKGVNLLGIIATLKIPDWSRATELAGWLDTIRSWGFEPRARQLSTSGREVCVVATPSGVAPRPPRHARKKINRRGPHRAKRPPAE
jgi:23S rRNA (cytidine2498-2'-O)-methyltransferase